MLTACNGSAGIERIAPGAAPNPVVEVRHEQVTVCPAELANAPAVRPQPGPGAVIDYNAGGRDWLAATIAWGESLFDTLTDARAQCPAQPEKVPR